MRSKTERISPLLGRTLVLCAAAAALSGCVITLNAGDDGDESATEGSTNDDTTAEATSAATGGHTTELSDGSTGGEATSESGDSDSDSDSDSGDSDSDSDGAGGCGDGVVDPGEACDDGDLDDFDGCLSTCELASCGDGIVHFGVEACDDGNDVDDDGCSTSCVRATCEDGVRNGGESAIDCGGRCSACELGEACGDSTDCLSGACAAGLCVSPRHCLDALALGVGDSDGEYVIDSDGPDGPLPPRAVFCDMSLEGGGWTAIYNRGDAIPSFAEAAAFEASLAAVADAEVVYPWSESQAIHSGGLDLGLYHEALFAWEPADTLDPTRYAILTREGGLAGLCVVDGTCPGATSLGEVDVFPSGEVVEVFTGDPQQWPQVGLGVGVGDQTILWGYDRHASAFGNWANWALGGPAGLAGNTAEIAAGSWRYAIYIR